MACHLRYHHFDPTYLVMTLDLIALMHVYVRLANFTPKSRFRSV